MLPDVNLIGKACYEGFRRRASAPVERSVAVPRSALPWSELPDSLKACWLEAAMSANEEARRQVDALAAGAAVPAETVPAGPVSEAGPTTPRP